MSPWSIPPKEPGWALPTSVEDDLAGLPEAPRVALEKLRKTIKAAAPSASVQELTTNNPLSSALVKKITKARVQEHTAPPRR